MKTVIANNSVILRNIISDMLTEAGHDIVECISSGKRVVELAENHEVDLILLGENLSEINESEVVKSIGNLVPILVVGSNKELLKLGAVDIIDKPQMDQVHDKEYILHFISVINKCTTGKLLKRKSSNSSKKISHIVIGSSTGGPNALRDVLGGLPADFPVPISIVQHLEKGHEEGLANWLNDSCKLNVRVAVDNDRPKPGEVIMGVQGTHLTVSGGLYHFTDEERVNFQKPAIDLQFTSAAKYYKGQLLGVLLTGMGADGANGCLDILNSGGETVVQDEHSSTVYGMPKAAAELGAATVILPLKDIADYIISAVKRGR